MARIILVASLALFVAASLATAQEAPEQADLLHKAHFLMSQERFEEAVALLEKAVVLVPHDRILGAKAYLMLGEALARSGRHADALKMLDAAAKHYHDLEQFNEAARALSDRIRKSERDRIHEAEIEKAHAAELENIERDLKARGLEGDQLREAYESARRGILAAVERKRITEMLKLAGVSAEEIEERLLKIDAERQRLTEEQKRIDERRAARDRDIARGQVWLEEAERSREGDWRAQREQDARGAREEFRRLAERLGIGPEETERFLKEHAPRPEPAGHDPRVDDIIHHVEELERRANAILEQVRRKLHEMDDRLTRIERMLEGK